MPDLNHTIENLMKVSLNIHAGGASAENDAGTAFEFIYGVGPAGITLLEKALFGKGIGDQIIFDVAPTDFCEAVGHLERPLRKQTGIMAPVSMHVTITGIVRAQDREVIKAMATGGDCSDCGCGCGGH